MAKKSHICMSKIFYDLKADSDSLSLCLSLFSHASLETINAHIQLSGKKIRNFFHLSFLQTYFSNINQFFPSYNVDT